MTPRLIDANAVRQWWLENGQNEKIYDTNDFLDSIDNWPTFELPNKPLTWDELHQLEGQAVYIVYKHSNNEFWAFIRFFDEMFESEVVRLTTIDDDDDYLFRGHFDRGDLVAYRFPPELLDMEESK